MLGVCRTEVGSGSTYTIPKSNYGGLLVITEDTYLTGIVVQKLCPYHVPFSIELDYGVVVRRDAHGGNVDIVVPSDKNVLFVFIKL